MLSIFIFFLIFNLRCCHQQNFDNILWAKRSIFCCQLCNNALSSKIWTMKMSFYYPSSVNFINLNQFIFPLTLQIDNIDRLRAVLYWNGGVHIHAELGISACYLLYCWGPRVSLPLKFKLLCLLLSFNLLLFNFLPVTII